MSGLLLKSRDDFDTSYNRRDAMSDDQLAQIFNFQQEDISEIEEELEDHDDDGEPAIVEEEQGDEKTPDEEEEEDVGPSQPGRVFHQRCACHILSLCVKDGLTAIGTVVENVKWAVRLIWDKTHLLP
ncbi:unnamed protein product [Cuscuta epithymum]|uniref:Uncharacterized protein n=1 Tax=Cuscuta epithymum TaxID=186058 RepID=A0AAV0G4I1_9ASTE|nr:unnamed protein product [Cuscuta epithymum]